jgi:ElaB/YqjD/DUF883 family membrane-anchored ribosome-binding protein
MQGSGMAGIDEAFWGKLDARISATFVRASTTRRQPTVSDRSQAARLHSAGPRAAEDMPVERYQVSDWTGLVDTIAAAGVAAEEKDTRLRRQSAAYEALAHDLKRALDDVEMYKALVQEAREQAEAKAREIQARADARIEEIQARADARIRHAEERAHVAGLRVVVVDDWLVEIERASRELLPSSRTTDARHDGDAAAA